MPTQTASRLPRHFLFMLPLTTSTTERNAVIDWARRLSPQGYVYIASAHEKVAEDRDGIRFLPLHAEALPCFGEVTAACVLHDESIAKAARQAYPGAQVIVINSQATEKEVIAAKSGPEWLVSSEELEISQAA